MPQTKSKHTAMYGKHPRLAFQKGYYERVKVKRHYHQKYDRYHYYLPARMSPVVRFLKRYFQVLDAICDVEKKYRIRQTEFEFAELAILAFHHIRYRCSSCDPIVVGSQYLNPIPWAVFGPTLGVPNKIVRNHFTCTQDIFQHYDQYMWGGGYNVTTIERPLGTKAETDALIILADIYDRSANFILAMTLLLLCDLIKHCGPDADEFRPLFTNDRRRRPLDKTIWQKVRAEVIPLDFEQLRAKALCFRSNTTQAYASPFYHCPYARKPKQTYFDVEIRDAYLSSHVDLTQGEKVEYHGGTSWSSSEEKEKPMLLLPYYGDPDLSLEDVDDNDEASRLDSEYRQIVGSPPAKSRPLIESRRDEDWREIARGWAGLD
jgi:hypothetical protein